MSKMNILNEGRKKIKVEFADISSELFRQYEFPDGYIVRIESPTLLYVSKSGGHRLVDASGISHYVPCGWRHLWWKSKEGQPYFVR